MIQTKIQFNLHNARVYFREHLGTGDYYSEGEKVSGEWLGAGAIKLGLIGQVAEQPFLALCEGQHPETGGRLGQRMNSVRQDGDDLKANRRIFFDFTIAPPKSVSVVALIQDPRIIAIHDQAVRETMRELETRAESRVRKSGQNKERITGNLVTACFRHETSRELDPHLHTHCVVMNATFDAAENRWKALHPAGMYRAHRFATNFYRHELCKGLQRLGYEIENNSRGFEIAGIPQSLVDRFSKRHQQIDIETRDRLAKGARAGNLNDLRERVAHGNRRRKLKNSSADRLRERWKTEMLPTELAALRKLSQSKSREANKADLGEILTWAEEHLFERRAVVPAHELIAAALERGRGLYFDLSQLRQAIEQRDYVREKDSERLTSREVLHAELEAVSAAHDGRNQHPPLNPKYEILAALSSEQAIAVQQILRSRDFITLLRGGAGTGKSFALKEVERGLLAAAFPVVVLAPQRQQVQDLQKDGLNADTLAHFLLKKSLGQNSVVIVDEAGQIGGRQLAELIRIVRSRRGRLILSGDTRQHGAVAASDALRAIEKYSGLKPATIQAIRRQDPKLGKRKSDRTFIRTYRNAVKAAANGEVPKSFDLLDGLGCVRESAPGRREEALAEEYLAATDRQEKALVVASTRAEVRAINEVVRRKFQEVGKLGKSQTLTIYEPVDLDNAQKKDARFYVEGNFANFVRGYGRFGRGDICSVVGADHLGVVVEKNGIQSRVSYRYTDRITVVVAKETEIATGDRLQLKFNGNSSEGLKLNNGEIVTVRNVTPDGSLGVESAGGGRKTLTPSQRLLVRGFAVTSYGSQGKTVDTVILSDPANRAATDAHQWYVSISRGRKRVVVFTEDKEALRQQIQGSGERGLAMDLNPASASATPRHMYRLTQRSMVALELSRQHDALMRLRSAAVIKRQLHP